ncbi:MAG: formylglycine-generating enzyme family protein [Chloroflexi bacterium]|nr:formylglycine-generating enzyme family protein [Chloroflexota bacterium]
MSSDVPVTVPIGAGEFVMGSDTSPWDDEEPQHRVNLPAYRIGKYPVTNAQYRRFVADDGYMRKWRGVWTNAGWRWREENQSEKPAYWDNPRWNLDNHPVVGVSWYEAIAYCNWLSKTTGRKFHLPREAEWEKAARGTDGRDYPWGDEFDKAKCNTNESGIGTTTPVGIYADGASPCGALDMAGNVWEWCSSRWGQDFPKPDFTYPYRADDGREDLQSTDRRIVRGGSWDAPQGVARCAFRLRNHPVNRNSGSGFRVAESSPAVDSES